MYKESILFREYDVEMLSGFLGVEFNSDELDFLQKEQNRKIEKKEKFYYPFSLFGWLFSN